MGEQGWTLPVVQDVRRTTRGEGCIFCAHFEALNMKVGLELRERHLSLSGIARPRTGWEGLPRGRFLRPALGSGQLGLHCAAEPLSREDIWPVGMPWSLHELVLSLAGISPDLGWVTELPWNVCCLLHV